MKKVATLESLKLQQDSEAAMVVLQANSHKPWLQHCGSVKYNNHLSTVAANSGPESPDYNFNQA